MFCVKCGAKLPGSASFCRACGQKTADDTAEVATFEMPPPLPLSAAPPEPRREPLPVKGAAAGARYAGFWRRVAASFLDGLIQAGFGIVLGIVLALVAGSSSSSNEGSMVAAYYLGGIAIAWLYFATMHSSSRMASYGKRALNIKVVSLDGERISFGRASGRYFAYAFVSSIFTLGIGLVMTAFTSRKQALHDLMAGTLVVSAETTPDDIAAGLNPPKASGGIIAVGILLGLVPVVGILAAIAIPAYQDYLIRAQVSEGLMMAAPYKAGVAEAYANGTQLDQISTEMIGADSLGGKYVEKIEVAMGAVVITYGGEANTHIAGKTIVIVPGTSEQEDVVWTCGRAPVPEGITPVFSEHEQYTDIEDKYLPSACRN